MNPGGAEIGFEHVAEHVVGDLAHEGGAPSERGHAGGGIGGGATGNLLPGQRHLAIEILGPIGIDQVHDPFLHAFVFQKAGFNRGYDVDNRIADGQDVKAGLGHARGFRQRFRKGRQPV